MKIVVQSTAIGENAKYIVQDGTVTIIVSDNKIEICAEDLFDFINELQEIYQHIEDSNG